MVENDLEICSVYGDILQCSDGTYYTTGEQRTDCMYCAMGAHLEEEPNRFQRMSWTHPRCYDFCMRNTKVIRRAGGEELYQPAVSKIWNWEIERDIQKKIKECGAVEFYQEYQVIHGLGMAQVLDYVGIPWTTWEAQGQMTFADFPEVLPKTA